MMDGIQPLTQQSFDAAVEDDALSLVAFWAPWCVPCQRMGELLNELAAECKGTVRFYRVNADEQPDLAERFTVQTLPAVLLFRSGCLVERTVGNKTKRGLMDLIRSLS